MTANCRGDHTRTSWAPAVKAILRVVPDEASAGERIAGPSQGAAGQGRWPCSREADFERRPSRGMGEGHREVTCPPAGHDQC